MNWTCVCPLFLCRRAAVTRWGPWRSSVTWTRAAACAASSSGARSVTSVSWVTETSHNAFPASAPPQARPWTPAMQNLASAHVLTEVGSALARYRTRPKRWPMSEPHKDDLNAGGEAVASITFGFQVRFKLITYQKKKWSLWGVGTNDTRTCKALNRKVKPYDQFWILLVVSVNVLRYTPSFFPATKQALVFWTSFKYERENWLIPALQ